MSHSVFITGATGYIGQRLVPLLIGRGHTVTAIVRPGSESRVGSGARVTVADPLREGAYTAAIGATNTLVHLIGTPHPSPAKAKQFREIDLVSVRVAVRAASEAGVAHFIYVSVAQPAPIMQAFIAVRQKGEEMLRASGMPATILRPWYVLGPGHRWAYALLPVYWVMERLPGRAESARRLGLITLQEMLDALVWSVEHPPEETRILEVPDIRNIAAVTV